MIEGTSFVRLFVGIILTATGVLASCPVEVSPPSVVVRYGDPVSINCSTTETEFEGMGWEATEGGKALQKANHLTWSLKNLTEWKANPSCFINPVPENPFKQCTVSPEIVVYTFPEAIGISSLGASDGVMREAWEYFLTCEILYVAPVQNLTVEWYKGDTVVLTNKTDNPSKEPVDQRFVFSVTPSREDNGVRYRCEARLDLEPEGPQLHAVSPGFTITVQFGPDVQCTPRLLNEGETLEEQCNVTGNPTPSVEWLKDGQLVDPTVPLRRGDEAEYTLKAEGLGLIEKNITIFIGYGPELTCPVTVTKPEFSTDIPTCIVEGYPKPNVTWTKDGEDRELSEKLTRSDMGQYVVTATGHSLANATVDIIIQYPPSQIVELEDSEVEMGSYVGLKCSSTGNPRPKYTWDYYQAVNVMVENEDGVSRLLIHNATSLNMGFYTCHAENTQGSTSKMVRVTVKGAEPECPIEITPDRMVIRYQSAGQNATCQPTSSGSRNMEAIGWTVRGASTDGLYWFVDTYNDWDPRPVCTAVFTGIGSCTRRLNFTLYKTPDSVSIRLVDDMEPVRENREFQLQCDITNVAPAGNLAVRWFRGNRTFTPSTKGSMRVMGCPSGNGTDCDISGIRSPLNVSSVINITLSRKDNEAEFRCEAQLDLGLQPPPSMMSSPLNITVFYKPTINTTKLPKTIPVFNGYPEVLVCEADGRPPPKIVWLSSPGKGSGENLTVSEAGFYNCSATNEVDSVFHEVEVILKEDYLPLIAGFVAVTVVAISIVFVFIYSIYYKNTRMRRYSLKNPKLNTLNGNVAHNGWDSQFPMTKLS